MDGRDACQLEQCRGTPMSINRLDHVSIRTQDLKATHAFYADVLGLTVGPRPDFPFPGVWLYQDKQAVVHVIGVDPNDSSGLMDYLGTRTGGEGSGNFDHVAFLCSDLDGMRAKFQAQKLEFRERAVPNMALDQIFLTDPNGITVELNFPAG
jgi:catechol 2,3-dioxygenase-like lactoylglutathione lyase family enzyme